LWFIDIIENKIKIMDVKIPITQLFEVVQQPVPGNVPAFLVKLWRIVQDETLDHIISWSQVCNIK